MSGGVVFPATFHPGTADAALATVVQLDGGQQRELEPMTLPPARHSYRLTGRVVFEDGRPARMSSSLYRMAARHGAKCPTPSRSMLRQVLLFVHEGLSYVVQASDWDEAQRKQVRGRVGRSS